MTYCHGSIHEVSYASLLRLGGKGLIIVGRHVAQGIDTQWPPVILSAGSQPGNGNGFVVDVGNPLAECHGILHLRTGLRHIVIVGGQHRQEAKVRERLHAVRRLRVVAVAETRSRRAVVDRHGCIWLKHVEINRGRRVGGSYRIIRITEVGIDGGHVVA